MNSKLIPSHSTFGARLGRVLARCAALAGVLALTSALQAQTWYNFDNGTDTGWQTSVSATHPATITYPNDALGGKAYRLQADVATSGSDTNARVLAILTNRMYTNFYASVDIVGWSTNQNCEQTVGILGRADNVTAGAANAVSFNASLHYKLGANGGRDQMTLWAFLNVGGTFYLPQLGVGAIAGPNTTHAGFRLIPGHSYRMVLSCTNSLSTGLSTYVGSIYDLNDLTQPQLSMTGDCSLFNFNTSIPAGGYAGVFAINGNPPTPGNPTLDGTVDVTFDNFYVAETAPTSVAFPATPHGLIGAPQVANRVPAWYKNFHPWASGITFNATTLTTTNAINTSAIKLYLNGVDVSAGLVISGFATNANVSYLGLRSNVVYDARIVLPDALGRSTTNDWTFDTFTDAYLASSAVKVIEAEDYNFGDGQFIDDPPASGWAGYDPYTDGGTTLINSGTGYFDVIGNNARVGGLDFFDYDINPSFGEDQYRHSDGVGTQQGNTWGEVIQTQSGYSPLLNIIGYPNAFWKQVYETQRSKYSSLNSTLQEYVVNRTEGGEWLNYTRIFDGSKSYNVYLRAACGLAQPVRLDQIIGTDPTGTTNTLGWFHVPSTFFLENFRYTPLVSTNGSLAVVNLSGTNTVRLTIDSPQNDDTKFGLSMNYFVLVPAAPPAPKLYSSTTVNGTYLEETGAVVDTINKTITLPLSGTTRFYRVAFTSQLTIKGLTFSGPNVVLTYQ